MGKPVTYRNVVTGRVVELTAPDPEMDRMRRWERLDAEDTAAADAGESDPGDGLAPLPAAPGGNASKEDWQAYAIARGMDETEACEMTRNDLRAHYEA